MTPTYEAVLRQIAELDDAELMLDPTWAKRVATVVLSVPPTPLDQRENERLAMIAHQLPLAEKCVRLEEENERMTWQIEEDARQLDKQVDEITALEAENTRLQQEKERLRDENELLREALEMSDCPYPVIADDQSVKACVVSGQCGCGNRAAMKGGEA